MGEKDNSERGTAAALRRIGSAVVDAMIAEGTPEDSGDPFAEVAGIVRGRRRRDVIVILDAWLRTREAEEKGEAEDA